jgi:hypothetical protein
MVLLKKQANIIIRYFSSIPAVPKKGMILSRLGYREGTTMLSISDKAQLEEGIKQGLGLCKPAGVYAIIPIFFRNDCAVTLENGIQLQSLSLSKLLRDSCNVVLMAATVGKEVTETVFHEVNRGNAAFGLILDSVASQTADASLDWMVQMLDKMLDREGRKLTRHRYSPGFGDLPLSCQKDIFGALQLDQLNMALTEKFMLIPEKSVIAIAGIEGRENR